jgi:cytidine deaminase
MTKSFLQFEFDVYDSIDELNQNDKSLLQLAREVTTLAYAPYSEFLVGAAAELNNGVIVKGTNQENASYSVGICAERTLLGNAAMLHPNIPIQTMAIAYHNLNGSSDEPVSPCGMCRQSINEFEGRTKQPIRLILSGMEGKVMIIEKASMLLPMSFGSENLIPVAKK